MGRVRPGWGGVWRRVTDWRVWVPGRRRAAARRHSVLGGAEGSGQLAAGRRDFLLRQPPGGWEEA